MIIYSGKKINVRKDEIILDDGRKAIREVIEHPGSAAIIPFITEDEIILIQQYRHAVKELIYEIPLPALLMKVKHLSHVQDVNWKKR